MSLNNYSYKYNPTQYSFDLVKDNSFTLCSFKQFNSDNDWQNKNILLFSDANYKSMNFGFWYNSIPTNFNLALSINRASVSDSSHKEIKQYTFNEQVVEYNKGQQEALTENEKFDKMLAFVLRSEGGYVANDCGQACNKGILQSTYDSYRKKNGLNKQNVKNITDEEVREIYYTMYYKASGADKIDDPKLALYVFDTAVNMGVSAAKKLLAKSDNNANKFEEARIDRYEEIAQNNPSKSKYLNGWKNRVQNVENFANREFIA